MILIYLCTCVEVIGHVVLACDPTRGRDGGSESKLRVLMEI